MSFNKYDTVEDLNDSKHDWLLRVRAQAIWKGITKETNSFRGYNVIFVDDCLCAKYEGYLIEGQIYKLNDFVVKYYNGDETTSYVRTNKHIYFTNETTCIKDEGDGMKIEPRSFDLFCLEDVHNTKNDNRYLINVVGVLDGTPTKIAYKKDDVEKSNVKFTLYDRRSYANVTFFNEFGEAFPKAMKEDLEQPVVIIIASAKINDWNDEVSLTNYPTTRFYINSSHHNILKLTEDYIEKRVQCKVMVNTFDKKVKWYTNYCAKYNTDIVPIIWTDEEVIRLCGKTVYDLIADDEEVEDGDKFPAALQQFEKKKSTTLQ
ncbi:hypothetical protein POM88_006738 [Heracleum sosnowskyi]|uniref:Uncharacterized protein n=1 Tax=Heracleum sosnowskyi TaxID=360622 RepID=A0AAD8J357_9APIA|nr:hypothetical protein POM88_006738 [Heracleum sosnowskyi]